MVGVTPSTRYRGYPRYGSYPLLIHYKLGGSPIPLPPRGYSPLGVMWVFLCRFCSAVSENSIFLEINGRPAPPVEEILFGLGFSGEKRDDTEEERIVNSWLRAREVLARRSCLSCFMVKRIQAMTGTLAVNTRSSASFSAISHRKRLLISEISQRRCFSKEMQYQESR